MRRARAPPIKTHGIKTRLVPFICSAVRWDGAGRWIEPFMGSGAVLFNADPERAIASDLNRHVITFYRSIRDGSITHTGVRAFLETEGRRLRERGESHYYEVRDRFNSTGDALDFLFLNRSCFNGLMRFNREGKYNVAFCRKPQRFGRAYITKIANQVGWVEGVFAGREWELVHLDWRDAVRDARPGDFVYLDPPYGGLSTGYCGTWTESDTADLASFLRSAECDFALSMWYRKGSRTNGDIAGRFGGLDVITHEHFYHVGPTEDQRGSVTEALIMQAGRARPDVPGGVFRSCPEAPPP